MGARGIDAVPLSAKAKRSRRTPRAGQCKDVRGMAAYSGRKSSKLSPQYPAPQANPNSARWKSHTNCSVLRDREFGDKQAPTVDTIKNPPPLTPVTKHGTLVTHDGNGGLL